VIAWKYPIVQSDLIKIRHNKAYDHIKMLSEREFIAKEKSGRTYKIKLTPKFFEYFDLPSNDAKQAFRKVIPQDIQNEIARAEEDIATKEQSIASKAQEKPAAPQAPKKTEEQLAQEAADALDSEEQ